MKHQGKRDIGRLIDKRQQHKIAKKKVGIGEKKLNEALHNAGYEYRNSAQMGWYYVGEGQEPLINHYPADLKLMVTV